MPLGVTYYPSIPSGAEPEEFYWRPKTFPMGQPIPSLAPKSINRPKLPITPPRPMPKITPRKRPGLFLRVLMEIDRAGPLILVATWILATLLIAIRDWTFKIF
jgi:hypothetical protein